MEKIERNNTTLERRMSKFIPLHKLANRIQIAWLQSIIIDFKRYITSRE